MTVPTYFPRFRRPLVAAALVAPLLLGACSDSPTQPATPGLRFVAGDGVSDTVNTLLAQALVVEVRDANGQLATGRTIRFETLPRQPGGFEVLVGQLDAQSTGSFVSETTDARGRAAVLVRLGWAAGPARLVVSVPELGAIDTARYTVLPGRAAAVRIDVRDTALIVGGSYTLGARAVDTYGNTAADQSLSYVAVDPAATVTSSGIVTAAATGRARIAIKGAGVTDTARVSVVPSGMIAAYVGTAAGAMVGSVSLDGSSLATYTSVTASVVMPTWNPAGDRIAFYEGDPYANSRIYVVDRQGVRSPLIVAPDSLAAQSFPRYSRDGQWIYFTGVTRNSYNYGVWRARSDGTAPEELVVNAGADYGWPDPSPDGRHVAFSAAGVVSIYDLVTGVATPTGVNGAFARYSPDGSQISFLSNGVLMVMNADGTGARGVVSGPTYDLYASPSWSPDGKWILIRAYSGLQLVKVADGTILPLPYSASLSQAAFEP